MRVASAIALGEIGGSESAVALERCAIYDKKDEVRKAATTALERLNTKAKKRAAGFVGGRAVQCDARAPGDVRSVAFPPIASAGPRATGW